MAEWLVFDVGETLASEEPDRVAGGTAHTAC
jgi:hypothetical protein